ncbi:MAG: Holliday junction branch migration protein RuvA [Candidatus Planktophila sp.]|jgi:holliday junction DNA helicase RuvA|tara:strand:+ start:385 stop:993 length:609 start_codon:yes stop_codon:yes gene_type:complete
MISLINGVVRSLSAERAIVDVGGVGLALAITARASASLNVGTSIQFFTTLVVREDSLTLFGFLDDEERSLFELVQTVSGIGPKVALSIVAALSPSQLSSAIGREDIAAIEKVPGIGRKGAQRLILELKGKLSDFSSANQRIHHQMPWREQLASALVSLGFSARDSDIAITNVVKQITLEGGDANSFDLADLLKLALQNGSRG